MGKIKLVIGVLIFILTFFVHAENIRVYFAPDHKVDRIILESIKHAKKSVYIASYTFNWPEANDTLSKCVKNGVDVKMLLQFSTPYLSNNIPVKIWKKKSSILHAKFAIIDGNCVFVGSANFTDSSLGWDSNNILFIDDKEIADFFSRNFMHLWLNLSLSDCYFLKKDYIEIYFSPLSDCLSIINNHIKQARQMIRFAMFSFTLDAIGQEICRAGLKGIKTYGIFEKSQNPVSNEYYFLKKLPFIHIKRDCFVKNIHDKFLIIDDNIVLTGSFNYTQSARKNIETLIVLRNNCLVSQYVKRWKHLWLWY